MTESTKTAIVTAVLTGVFTVIAGIATYWFTNKEPELSYSVVGGPALSNVAGSKRIFVVEVRNAGNKEVAQTLIQIDLKGGDLSETASEASPGIKLTEEKTQHKVDIRADLLNPSDTVKVSFLAALTPSETEPVVTVRSPGVKAVAASKGENLFDLKSTKGLLSLTAPALAAVLSTFIFMARVGVLGRILPGNVSSLERPELMAYLCSTCGLHEEANLIRFSGAEITYRGVGDFLRQKAQQQNPTDQRKYDIALRGLLLCGPMVKESVDVIREAINTIGIRAITEAEIEELRKNNLVEGNKPNEWRQRMDRFVFEQLNLQTARANTDV